MGMVERVARAVHELGAGQPDYSWERADEQEREKATRYARAAIEAMREPTEAQYEALCATDKMWRELDSKTVWQTYIDAALREPI